MPAEDSPSIRALARGIAVLQAINATGSASLTQIAATAELPHPTAIRIVRTLVDLGLIEREPAGKHYRATALVQSLSCGFQPHDRLVERARDPIVALTRAIGWPLSVVTRSGRKMVTRDSTVALTSLTFGVFQPGILMPIFGSASGELCFAFSSPEQQAEMTAHIAVADGDSPLLAGPPSPERIAEIRRAGYALGTRNPRVAGGGRTTSLATPVFVDGAFVGALVLVFFATALAPAEAVSRYFAALRDTCAEIADRLR